MQKVYKGSKIYSIYPKLFQQTHFYPHAVPQLRAIGRSFGEKILIA